MIGKSEQYLVQQVLNVIRKKRWDKDAEYMDDLTITVEDVLQALNSAGYCVVPRGYLDSIISAAEKIAAYRRGTIFVLPKPKPKNGEDK